MMMVLNASLRIVIPAKAGIQTGVADVRWPCLDSRFRGNDGVGNCDMELEA